MHLLHVASGNILGKLKPNDCALWVSIPWSCPLSKVNKLPGEEVNVSSLQNNAYFVQHGILKIWLYVHIGNSHVQDKSIVLDLQHHILRFTFSRRTSGSFR